jgi:hypothetical protein
VNWFQFWLILHILSVIVAFGPTFAFPVMGAYAGKHPEHGAAVAHLTHLIERRMVIPVAVLVLIFGTALIITGHFALWKSEWLLIGIILYGAALAFAVLVQNRNGAALVKFISSVPPGPPPIGAQPPPELIALTKKLQLGGMYLTLSIVVIVVLMVWRPGSCQGVC